MYILLNRTCAIHIQVVQVETGLWFDIFRRKKKKLECVLKSRDSTLPTKVRLVKALVFPVVMYGYESWTIKKAECQRMMLLNCGVGEDS